MSRSPPPWTTSPPLPDLRRRLLCARARAILCRRRHHGLISRLCRRRPTRLSRTTALIIIIIICTNSVLPCYAMLYKTYDDSAPALMKFLPRRSAGGLVCSLRRSAPQTRRPPNTESFAKPGGSQRGPKRPHPRGVAGAVGTR